PVRQGATVVNNYPTIRISALRLLSEIGTVSALDDLVFVVRHDPDPYVRAEAVRAIGDLRFDPEGDGIESIYAAINGRYTGRESEMLAEAALYTMEKLLFYYGCFTSDRGYDIVLHIFRGSYSRRIRERALALIHSM
ncbi:MAG: HEAT repeat domain-containing protein, partial [Spirochaetia bacterium]